MRCYNGAPDSELQSLLDNRNKLLAEIRNNEPDAHVTFHAPHKNSAGGYVVHVWGRELSKYHVMMEAALLDAKQRSCDHNSHVSCYMEEMYRRADAKYYAQMMS